ncbi:hypothetical protein BDN70DRAFT_938608 [Pholiota conissans]|uniref:Uncharacterized protein n=1 Tax=Pholiota conissans TaxID=109636 RepID=A0A9P6CMK9_9AGAR|nr:hypothetical protein BDN70DRAFT_938608 [Pholiota conissans]
MHRSHHSPCHASSSRASFAKVGTVPALTATSSYLRWHCKDVRSASECAQPSTGGGSPVPWTGTTRCATRHNSDNDEDTHVQIDLQMFESSSTLYLVRLHFDGLTDTGGFLTKSFSERVKQLLKHRQERLSPELTSYRAYDMIRASRAYACVGNLFSSTDGHSFIFLDLLVSRNVRDDGVSIVNELPSTGNRFAFKEFAMDPSQDLVAWLDEGSSHPVEVGRTFRVNICTISTNNSHLQVRHDNLPFTVLWDPTTENDRVIYNVCLEIAQCVLLLHFYTVFDMENIQPRVMTWDWTTSELIMVHPLGNIFL